MRLQSRGARWIALVLLALAAGCGAADSATPTAAPAATEAPAATQAPTATEAPAATAVPTETAAPTETATPTGTPTGTAAPTPAAGGPGLGNPAGYTFALVADGFASPLLVTHAGDGSGRLYVVEQGGRILIVEDGQARPEPFFDLTGQVSRAYEQGLLGLAFPPDFTESGLFYINYTDLAGDTHVDRCPVLDGDPTRADAAECTTVLTVDQPFPNHNGGHLAFDAQGYLYVALGDGGSGGDPLGNAQNLNNLLGKILRLEVSGDEAPYTAPPDNPFAGRDDARWEIFVYGLRNPWRFTFDRATGDMFIGDVGQNAYEEVDYVPAGTGGQNFGWNYFEGLHPYAGQPPAGVEVVPPIAEYAQAAGGCTVTSGYVYRGPSLPELDGVYFYGDFCTGLVWTLSRGAGDTWESAQFADSGFRISSFGEDEAGELYVVDHAGGGVYRLAVAGQ